MFSMLTFARVRWGLTFGLWLTMTHGDLLAQERQTLNGISTVGTDSSTGMSRAVIVRDHELIHTGQVVASPTEKSGAEKSPSQQASEAMSKLTADLEAQGSGFAQIVKLNVYVANLEAAAEVRQFLAKQRAAGIRPAVSFVGTRLPNGACVAVDAIAAISDAAKAKHVAELSRQRKPRIAGSRIMPVNPRVYISGQAEKAVTLSEATTKTLAGLDATLRHLDLKHEHVVQVKCFLSPMSEVRQAETAIVEHFGGTAPPCVFVEWQSSLPIEIELVAAYPEGLRCPVVPSLGFITPPGATASPVFCRVVRVSFPSTIYVSGLYAKDATDGAGQVTQIFEQLQDILKASGSDLQHLAKATYYVSDNDASAKLNELRPKFYDPQRPPAASKAQVVGVGLAGKSLTLDMIAVPKW